MRRHVSQVTFMAMIGVILILLIVQMLFVFLGQVGDLSATYKIGAALHFVLLQIPSNLYAILPIGALIGAVVGLGSLASSSELVVMRAAGVSVWRIVWWVLRPALLLGVLAFLVSQFLIPPAIQASQVVRDGAAAKNVGIRGYWHKDGESFAYISYANDQGQLGLVKGFDFSPDLRLTDSWQSPSGTYQANVVWMLHNVSRATIEPTGISTALQLPNQQWTVNLKPKLLSAATSDPEDLPPSQLYKYGRLLKADNTQVPGEYRLSFWKQVLAPLGLLSLVVLACAFVFGSLRNRSMGVRVVIALIVGLGFQYVQDFVGYVSLVAGGWTVLYVLLPIGAAFLFGGYALRRAR